MQSARHVLATLPHGRPSEPAIEVSESDMVQDDDEGLPGISEAIIKSLQDKAAEFSTSRKQRGKSVPEGLAAVDDIKKYVEKSCHDGIHSASVPGITALDLQVEQLFFVTYLNGVLEKPGADRWCG